MSVVEIVKLSGPTHSVMRRSVTSFISISMMPSSPFLTLYFGVRQISLTLSLKS